MSFLFGKPKTPSPDVKIANVNPYLVSTNQQSVPVPYLAGSNVMRLTWISSAFGVTVKDVVQKTGKKSKSTVARDYYANLAGVLCLGVLDSIQKIYFNTNLVWNGNLSRDGSGGGSIKKSLTITGFGNATIYWGTMGQESDPVLNEDILNPLYSETYNESTGNFTSNGQPKYLSGVSHPAYRGIAYIVFNQLYLGRDVTSAPNVDVVGTRMPQTYNTGLTNEGVNPVSIIYELFTSKFFGLGLKTSNLRLSTFSATSGKLAPALQTAAGTPQRHISCCLVRQAPIADLVADIAQYYEGWFRMYQGKIDAGLFPNAQSIDPLTLPAFNEEDMMGEPTIDAESFAETSNLFQLNYQDRDRHFQQNPANGVSMYNAIVTQEIRPVTINRPYIITASNAAKTVNQYAAINALPTVKGSFQCRRDSADQINQGDMFVLSYAKLGVSIIARAISKTIEKPSSLTVQIEFLQEPGILPQPYTAEPDPAPEPPSLAVSKLTLGMIFQLNKVYTGTETTTVAVLVERPTEYTLSMETFLSIDAGASYDSLGETVYFATFASLITASLTTGATTIRVKMIGVDVERVLTQTTAARDDNTLLIFIGNEIMSVGKVTSLGNDEYDITVLRARYGTTAAAHAQFARSFIIERANLPTYTSANFLSGAAVRFRMIPSTATETGSGTDALTINVTLADRSSDRPAITFNQLAFRSVELITGDNSEFTSTLGSWSANGSASIMASAGVMLITGMDTDPFSGAYFYGLTLVSGVRYRLRATLADMDDYGQFAVGTSFIDSPVFDGEIDFEFTCPETGELGFYSAGYAITTAKLDNVRLNQLDLIAGDTLAVSGGMTDENGDIIQYSVLIQRVNPVGFAVLEERSGLSSTVSPTGELSFTVDFTAMTAGLWQIVARAMDSRNNADGFREVKYFEDGDVQRVTVI